MILDLRWEERLFRVDFDAEDDELPSEALHDTNKVLDINNNGNKIRLHRARFPHFTYPMITEIVQNQITISFDLREAMYINMMGSYYTTSKNSTPIFFNDDSSILEVLGDTMVSPSNPEYTGIPPNHDTNAFRNLIRFHSIKDNIFIRLNLFRVRNVILFATNMFLGAPVTFHLPRGDYVMYCGGGRGGRGGWGRGNNWQAGWWGAYWNGGRIRFRAEEATDINVFIGQVGFPGGNRRDNSRGGGGGGGGSTIINFNRPVRVHDVRARNTNTGMSNFTFVGILRHSIFCPGARGGLGAQVQSGNISNGNSHWLDDGGRGNVSWNGFGGRGGAWWNFPDTDNQGVSPGNPSLPPLGEPLQPANIAGDTRTDDVAEEFAPWNGNGLPGRRSTGNNNGRGRSGNPGEGFGRPLAMETNNAPTLVFREIHPVSERVDNTGQPDIRSRPTNFTALENNNNSILRLAENELRAFNNFGELIFPSMNRRHNGFCIIATDVIE